MDEGGGGAEEGELGILGEKTREIGDPAAESALYGILQHVRYSAFTYNLMINKEIFGSSDSEVTTLCKH